jgi:cysteine desulfurase
MRVNKIIFLDHQASTPIDPAVVEQMAPYYEEDFANPHSSGHALGWRAAAAVEKAASNVADLIGADADEIVFTSGATEANNLALIGHARHHLGGGRRRIIVSPIEHKCVLEALCHLEDKHGFTVEFVPVDRNGLIDLDALKKSMSNDVLLVSIGAVNSEIGTIQSIEKISAITHEFGAIFHCDAAQAPLTGDITDYAQHTDMLSLSAHKFYGPKGIGALYIRRDLKREIEPLIFGGGQQDGLRSGTLPTPLCVGFGHASALRMLPDAIQKTDRLRALRNLFVDSLQRKSNPIDLNGPNLSERHPGNANIRFEGIDARLLLAALQPGISASMGSACASGIPEPSYVLRSIGLDNDGANSSIRFSLGFGTSEVDVADAVDLISSTLANLSNDIALAEAS